MKPTSGSVAKTGPPVTIVRTWPSVPVTHWTCPVTAAVTRAPPTVFGSMA